jgi:tetratricopeptide (TPR) repeat protein
VTNNQDIPQEEWERMESYVLNTMPPDERVVFEKQLSGDDGLQAKLAEVRLLMLGVSEVVLQEKLATFHRELQETAPVRSIRHMSSTLKIWLAAAAVIVVMAMAAWFIFYGKNKDEKIYAAYFKPDPGLITAMSATDNYAFEEAMIHYKRGDYPAAIRAWDSLQKVRPGDDTLTYFLGIARLANGEAAAAQGYLEKVSRNNRSLFREDAFWYLGLALLKQGNSQAAIRSIEQSTHAEREALLAELRKRRE